MVLLTIASVLSLGLGRALAQSGVISPLARACPGYSNNTDVVCINRYASAMPPSFERQSSTGGVFSPNDTFVETQVPSDPSFGLVKNATFVVFDQRGSQILGPSPKLESVFASRNDSIHEGPVYVPSLDAIIFSLPHQGIYQQQIIHLNDSTPRLENYTTTPPVYAVNGGKLFNGKIYWAVEAGFSFPSPQNGSLVAQRPGIYELDPSTGEVTTLLNNYFGQAFNSPNDLWVDDQGDIWFTDSWYGYAINVTVYPVLRPATYRFRPSTGRVSIVEDSIAQPNGIGMSPDRRTMYISDTGVTDFENYPADGPLVTATTHWEEILLGSYIINKRPIYQAQTFGDDGFHVAQNGYLIAAEGGGVTVLSEYGEMLLRIETGFTVNNIQFAGPERKDLWVFGEGEIARVTWDLVGMANE
ncbi:calcium-dependent phosphotriesterase [Aureobasidium pullulans EXF-150]|uniref:Calcium-dependent phosphotriesterase n=1 Tax=Aureobasidium pullulans EXF-150 TaxID=1043002 RepID=A0A074X4T1_AURPU|nr:calcium-dependent phosphotriesterase [Aureobasidium pullulans EXF-150]KEQ78774.1 calcium-dependent phosphotriesterase [Aureobasidium pullulans EXF-150]